MAYCVALLRGINVGGNSIILMSDLRECIAELGAKNVTTYIQSGNVLFGGGRKGTARWAADLESVLSDRFGYNAMVVVRSHDELRAIVEAAPAGFGSKPDRFRYDVLFLKEPLGADDALAQIEVAPGVDSAHSADGVLYFSRLIEKASKSKLNKLVGQPIYKQMTIRNWRTTTRLLSMLDELALS